MDNIEKITNALSNHRGIPYLDREHGYYSASTIAKSPQEVFAFCQIKENVEKVLADLPLGLDNFLNLTFIIAAQVEENQYRINWKNTGTITGDLNFLLTNAPLNRGTIITAEAIFEKIQFKEEGPSTLMNLFLKRMKALMETGEIATTTGQSSGREEVKTHKDNLN